MIFIKWIKENKIILIIIGVSMVTAIIVNIILSYNWIPSVGTDSGQWLGFWGSFLGGIIGGIATLLGVKSTIKQMEKENKDKNKPVIIPYKVNYSINIKCGKHIIRNYIPKIDEKVLKDYKDQNKNSAHIFLMNISIHNAINVKVNWYKPEIEEINKYIVKDSKEIESIIKRFEELKSSYSSFEIPLIRSIEFNGFYEIFLYEEISQCIYLLLEIYESISNKFCKLPVGIFEIISYDIYGQKFIDKFNICMIVQCYTSRECYDVKIEFCKLKES